MEEWEKYSLQGQFECDMSCHKCKQGTGFRWGGCQVTLLLDSPGLLLSPSLSLLLSGATPHHHTQWEVLTVGHWPLSGEQVSFSWTAGL